MPSFNGGWVNSLAPGGFENIFQNVFFKLISWIDTLSNSCETALRSMPQNPSDDKSTLVQVMAWCRQAASHYLSQCCPRSLSPYGVTRPQWVKLILVNQNRIAFCDRKLHISYVDDDVITWGTRPALMVPYGSATPSTGTVISQGSLLLLWTNLNSSIDRSLHSS